MPGVPILISQQEQATTNPHGTPQPTTIKLADPGHVLFWSPNSPVEVSAKLRGVVADPYTKPRIRITERDGRASTTDYAGREPYQTVVPIMFDAYAAGGSIENKLDQLDQLARRAPGRAEPPIVRVEGVVPDRVRRNGWRIVDFQPIDGRRTEYTVAADRRRDLGRSRISVDVVLVERVVDDLLEDRLQSGQFNQGIHVRTTKVLRGEKLRDIARRVYKDPSMAILIAQVNTRGGRPMLLGQVLHAGIEIKLPY